MTAATSMTSGRLLHRVPLAARFAAGQALLAAGLLALTAGVGAAEPWWHLLPGLALTGMGIGFTNPLSAQAHLGVLPPAKGGLASGINNTARQLGVALGTAAAGALLHARVTDALEGSPAVGAPGGGPGQRADLISRLAGPDPESGLDLVSGGAREALRQAYEQAYATGLDDVLVISAAIAAAGIVVAATMVRESDMWVPEASPRNPRTSG